MSGHARARKLETTANPGGMAEAARSEAGHAGLRTREKKMIAFGRSREAPVVNISFHGVGLARRDITSSERHYWISEASCARLFDLIEYMPHVRVSVDDGNSSDVEVVLPLLRRKGLRATVFIPAGKIGSPGYLTASDVQALAQAGMAIGSHGLNHVNWRHIGDAALHEEIWGSRDALERIVGESVDTLAIPYGQYDARIVKALRRAGYKKVYTSDPGASREDAWLQRRQTVSHLDTPDTMGRLLDCRSTCSERLFRSLKRAYKRLR